MIKFTDFKVLQGMAGFWSSSLAYSVLYSYFFEKCCRYCPLRLYNNHKKLTKKDHYNKMRIEFKEIGGRLNLDELLVPPFM